MTSRRVISTGNFSPPRFAKTVISISRPSPFLHRPAMSRLNGGDRFLGDQIGKGPRKECLPGVTELTARRLVDIDKDQGRDGQQKDAIVALVQKRPESLQFDKFFLQFGVVGLAQGTLAEADDLLPQGFPVR